MAETKSNTTVKAVTTPGPWRVLQGSDERDFIVAEPGGNTVCEPNADLFGGPNEFDPSVRRIDIAEAKANARLIAAAPDLLASCNELRLALAAAMRVMSPSEQQTNAFVVELTRAKVQDGFGVRAGHAIARAEGRDA